MPNIILQKLVASVLAVGMLFSNSLNNISKPNTSTIPNEQQTIQKDTISTWIDDLARYENCPTEGIFDVHSNSYGCLCFKENTFKVYVKLYNLLPETEDNELMNLIGDCEFQKKLAYKMIEDNPLNYSHWITSVKRGLGIPK